MGEGLKRALTAAKATRLPAGSTPCPVKGCERHAKPNQLMCWPHWRRVPKALNHAVFDTCRNMRSEPEAYRQARSAAIEAVETKEADEKRAN